MKIRNQTRIPGVKRIPLPACVLKEIREGIEAEARKYRVSKSFVIAVILAEAFKISKQEDYHMVKGLHLRRVK